jgi:hypothetical protein
LLILVNYLQKEISMAGEKMVVVMLIGLELTKR